MQRVIILSTLFIASLFGSYAQEKQSFTITVNISGMKSDKGDVYVALYNSEKDFLKKEFKGAIVTMENKKATAIFKNIARGMYAISVFHDKNDNKKMDTNFVGIPKEPTGMSNGAKAFFGPPKYKDAKFMVEANVVMPIKVK